MGNLRDMKNVAKMGYSSHLDTFTTIIATFKVSKKSNQLYKHKYRVYSLTTIIADRNA